MPEKNWKEKTSRFMERSNCFFVLGHCPLLSSHLDNNLSCYHFLPRFVSSLFRGVSQVAFGNNPFSGLLILLALFNADFLVGLGALVASVIALGTALVLGIDEKDVEAGLPVYNGLLIGTITVSLYPSLFPATTNGAETERWEMWIWICVGSSITVVLNSCIINLLQSKRKLLPPLTIAFNIVQLLIFVCVMPEDGPQSQSQIMKNLTENSTIPNNFEDIFKGGIKSVGQVYGVENLASSILILVALCLYSPLHSFTGLTGAMVGTVCGFFLGNLTDVRKGLWGYNGFLSAVAIGGFYFIPSKNSFLLAGLNTVSASVVQKAFDRGFKHLNLPYLTIPYLLTTLTFLQSSNGEKVRGDLTFPEKHFFDARNSQKEPKETSVEDGVTSVDLDVNANISAEISKL